MRKGMRESYIEVLATHGGPQPCVGDPRGRSDALDRGARRPAIEPRKGVVRGADAAPGARRPPFPWASSAATRKLVALPDEELRRAQAFGAPRDWHRTARTRAGRLRGGTGGWAGGAL